MFLCGTAAELTPIREVDGRKIGNGDFRVTRKLQAAYDDVVRGRNKKYGDWLEYVAQFGALLKGQRIVSIKTVIRLLFSEFDALSER